MDKWDPENWPEMEGCMGEACVGGRECPCWQDGEEEGSFHSQEEAIADALDAAREAQEKIFRELIEPLEDRLILREDKSVLEEVNRLVALRGRVLGVVS